jgi:uncharacterized protein
MRIGVISDTHRYLHANVFALFAGVGAILHAGDVGSDDVLALLETIAPVTAVRGNMDHHAGAMRLPGEARVERAGLRVVVVHDGVAWLAEHGGERAALAGVDLFVRGHTHVPEISAAGGCVLLNPGSATYSRHGGAPTVAVVEVVDARPQAEIVPLSEDDVD